MSGWVCGEQPCTHHAVAALWDVHTFHLQLHTCRLDNKHQRTLENLQNCIFLLTWSGRVQRRSWDNAFGSGPSAAAQALIYFHLHTQTSLISSLALRESVSPVLLFTSWPILLSCVSITLNLIILGVWMEKNVFGEFSLSLSQPICYGNN